MTNSSCGFLFFSPVITLERGNRNPSTSRVAWNVMDVSVKSTPVVLFVSCATSLARMKGCSVSSLFVKTHRVPIGVSESLLFHGSVLAKSVHIHLFHVLDVQLHCFFTHLRKKRCTCYSVVVHAIGRGSSTVFESTPASTHVSSPQYSSQQCDSYNSTWRDCCESLHNS